MTHCRVPRLRVRGDCAGFTITPPPRRRVCTATTTTTTTAATTTITINHTHQSIATILSDSERPKVRGSWRVFAIDQISSSRSRHQP